MKDKYLKIIILVVVLILIVVGIMKFREYQINKSYIERICKPICWYVPENNSWSIPASGTIMRYFPTQNDCLEYCLSDKPYGWK